MREERRNHPSIGRGWLGPRFRSRGGIPFPLLNPLCNLAWVGPCPGFLWVPTCCRNPLDFLIERTRASTRLQRTVAREYCFPISCFAFGMHRLTYCFIFQCHFQNFQTFFIPFPPFLFLWPRGAGEGDCQIRGRRIDADKEHNCVDLAMARRTCRAIRPLRGVRTRRAEAATSLPRLRFAMPSSTAPPVPCRASSPLHPFRRAEQRRGFRSPTSKGSPTKLAAHRHESKGIAQIEGDRRRGGHNGLALLLFCWTRPAFWGIYPPASRPSSCWFFQFQVSCIGPIPDCPWNPWHIPPTQHHGNTLLWKHLHTWSS